MNRIFIVDYSHNLLLVTPVANYIISFEHEFCQECSDILDDYDFTELNFDEIVNSGDYIHYYSECAVSGGHGINIRPK
jgi:hypothetical protein